MLSLSFKGVLYLNTVIFNGLKMTSYFNGTFIVLILLLEIVLNNVSLSNNINSICLLFFFALNLITINQFYISF